MPNPFKPTAGAVPPLLLGRDPIVEDFRVAVHDGPGAPGLLSLVTGGRGVGKTVMLAALGDTAREEGWFVIDETATPGFVDRIAEEADELLQESGHLRRGRIRSVSIAQLGSIELEREPRVTPSWRRRISALLAVAEERHSGVLITLDEIHAVSHEELAFLAGEVQHLIRDGRAVGLVMAGLPAAVEDLLSGDVTTFLRRAERIVLGNVDVALVLESLKHVFSQAGVEIDESDLRRAAEATSGYPFMIQLVGYHLWRQVADVPRIDSEGVDRALAQAQARIGNLVHAPALADVSEGDRRVLDAMASCDGPVSMAQLRELTGHDTSYLSVYRNRLIKAGLVRSAGYGMLDFAMPYLREYLRSTDPGSLLF